MLVRGDLPAWLVALAGKTAKDVFAALQRTGHLHLHPPLLSIHLHPQLHQQLPQQPQHPQRPVTLGSGTRRHTLPETVALAPNYFLTVRPLVKHPLGYVAPPSSSGWCRRAGCAVLLDWPVPTCERGPAEFSIDDDALIIALR